VKKLLLTLLTAAWLLPAAGWAQAEPAQPTSETQTVVTTPAVRHWRQARMRRAYRRWRAHVRRHHRRYYWRHHWRYHYWGYPHRHYYRPYYHHGWAW
jgi:hypothetical protein